MFTLSGSVGRKGANSASDVGAVQFLLNLSIGRLTPLSPLVVDGESGAKTIGMIEEFQRRVVRMRNLMVVRIRAGRRSGHWPLPLQRLCPRIARLDLKASYMGASCGR